MIAEHQELDQSLPGTAATPSEYVGEEPRWVAEPTRLHKFPKAFAMRAAGCPRVVEWLKGFVHDCDRFVRDYTAGLRARDLRRLFDDLDTLAA